MPALGAIDAVYRLGPEELLVSGWCPEQDPEALLEWRLESGESGMQPLGHRRRPRADVVDALAPDQAIPMLCGFELSLAGVPAWASQISLRLGEAQWLCTVEEGPPRSRSQGSIDAAYRLSSAVVLVGGWSSEGDPSKLLQWETACGASGSEPVGAIRLRRPELPALDGGFLVALSAVPPDAECLRVSIADLAWDVEVEDLRAIAVGEAVDRCLALCHWRDTPAERLGPLWHQQGLGAAILAMLQEGGWQRAWADVDARLAPQSGSDRDPLELGWLVMAAPGLQRFRLQLLALLSALQNAPASVGVVVVANPVWALFNAEELRILSNLLALSRSARLRILCWTHAKRTLQGLLQGPLATTSAKAWVLLGAELLPVDHQALQLVEAVPDSPSPVSGYVDGAASEALLALPADGCWLAQPHQQSWQICRAPWSVWSRFRWEACIEKPPASEEFRPLAAWRHSLEACLAEAALTEEEM